MNENETENILPKYTFSKNVKINERYKNALLNTLDHHQMPKKEQPLPMSSERKKEIQNLSKYQITWIQENLQIDLSKRTPDIEKIHFFTEEALKRLNTQIGKNNSSGSHFAPSNEIHVAASGKMLIILSHELIHSLATVKFDVKISENNESSQLSIQEPYTYGYKNVKNKSFFLFNEAITEMLNIEIADNMRINNQPDYLTNNTIGYGETVIFLDALIKKTAQLNNLSEKEIRYSLYKGYLKGDHSYLRIFKKTFGIEAIKFLSILDNSHASLSNIRVVAEKFGLDVEQLKNKCEQYVEQHQTIQIMENIQIN